MPMLKNLTFKINARTYQMALKAQLELVSDLNVKDLILNKLNLIKNKKITSWIDIEPISEYSLLRFEKSGTEILVPFFSSEEVFMNVLDIKEMSTKYSFSTLEFTENVFLNTMSLLVLEGNETVKMEEFGSELYLKKKVTKEEAIEFCRRVCEWGRQDRVFSNIKRHNPNNYGDILSDWFNYALKNKNPSLKEIRDIALMGDNIKGLGMSFASKHLRMLNPKVFPVLDDVLAKGLGFMLNEHGYALFINYIHEFKTKNKNLFDKDLNVAEIEMILFLLTRQFVRSEVN
jgi:hypothetical protein